MHSHNIMLREHVSGFVHCKAEYVMQFREPVDDKTTQGKERSLDSCCIEETRYWDTNEIAAVKLGDSLSECITYIALMHGKRS